MIELTPPQQEFIDAQVAAGLFKEPSEVVEAALDLLQQRQREFEQLRNAIGHVERGEFEALDVEHVKRRGGERRAHR